MANLVEFVYEGKDRLVNLNLIVSLSPVTPGRSYIGESYGYWTGYRYINSNMELFFFKTKEEAQSLYDLFRGKSVVAENATTEEVEIAKDVFVNKHGIYTNLQKTPTISKEETVEDLPKGKGGDSAVNIRGELKWVTPETKESVSIGPGEFIEVNMNPSLEEAVEAVQNKQKLDKIREYIKAIDHEAFMGLEYLPGNSFLQLIRNKTLHIRNILEEKE